MVHASEDAASNATGVRTNEEILGELWGRHAREISDRCRVLMRNSEDAKEAVSRTMLRVAMKLPQYGRGIADERSWALAVTYRVCMDLYRERVRRREEPIDAAGEPPAHLSAPVDDPERRALAKELESVVINAIRELPERLQSAMWLYVWSGSYRDVAELLRITQDNARKRVQEARTVMRLRLAEYRKPLATCPLSKCGRG